jgi:hypothetical protein
VPSAPRTIGIYAAILFTQGLINTFGVHLLKYLNNVSVWWHAVGTTSLVIAILAKVRCSQGPWRREVADGGAGAEAPERVVCVYAVHRWHRR